MPASSAALVPATSTDAPTDKPTDEHVDGRPDGPLDGPEPSAGPTFADLGLPAALHAATARLGFAQPTAIQAQAIPALRAGRDLVGVAQTGTGKTAAFGLPLLAAVDPTRRFVQAVVLTPTRELAMQVADAIASFAAQLDGLQVVAVYGGAPFGPQRRALAGGAQVVVGTPGRVLDHLDRGGVTFEQARFVVLDEADEMLRMGFAEDVDRVLAATPDDRQTALFSATMPAGIRRVATAHLRNPVEVAVTRQATTVAGVRQSWTPVPRKHQVAALRRVLAVTEADATIVFVPTRESAEQVGSALVASGLSAAYLSGDVAQAEREKIVDRLRTGALDVLVATDVAARGLDVERVGLVVNLDVPRQPEAYVHRIGRTGRAGRAGEALTFVATDEQARLRRVEQTTGVPLVQVDLPTADEVAEHAAGRVLAAADAGPRPGDVYRARVLAHLAQRPDLDPVDLLAAVLAHAAGDTGDAASRLAEIELDEALARARVATRRTRGPHERTGLDRPSHDRTTHDRAQTLGRSTGGRRERTGLRYRVAVGHRDGLRPGALVGALTGEGGLTGEQVGKIDIFGAFSLVEIPGGLTPDVLARLARTRVAGRTLHLRADTGPHSEPEHRRPAAGRVR